MAKRTGIPTLHDLAREMCIFLSRYSGVIAHLYPENATLLAALAAALAACGTLRDELGEVRDYGD